MKNQKIEVTKYVLTQLNRPTDDKTLRTFIRILWKNPRQKLKGGLSLTKQGFESLTKAEIKSYRIKFEEILNFDNKIILGLDNFINAPFYVTSREIHVFDETTAIQLVLFGGDVKKFVNAKHKNIELA